MNEELYAFLQAFDNDDLPDGAWQAMIEDGVRAWNNDKSAKRDPFDTFLQYVAETERQENRSNYDSVSTGGSHREDT